jgi:alpha-glucosidase
MKAILFLLTTGWFLNASGQVVSSPDGKVVVEVNTGKELMIRADRDRNTVLFPSRIGLLIRGLQEDWRTKKIYTRKVDQIIYPPVAEKRKEIRDHFNELTIEFRSKISLQVRAYNDGFAYRFMSALSDSIIVENEIASYELVNGMKFYGPPVNKRDDVDEFHTSFEEPYLIQRSDSVPADKLFFSPVFFSMHDEYPKVVITESDLEDYPGMFLQFKDRLLHGVYARYPKAVRVNPGEYPAEVVTGRENFIARTTGTRTFPWRVFMIEEKDAQFPQNDLVYRLASPSRIADAQWIRPGKGTDEWIIGINLFNVPFKAGVNTETYKYYIDFAKRFGFQRIMMDAGWSETTDLFKINPNIDMDEISSYAKRQGVGLSMWTLAHTLNRQLEPALQQFKKWGVDFIMTDFMDRDDQKMVNFYHRIAKACAEQKIMVMYHGAFKPAGFSRTWPNAITREGVLGSEYNIWSDKANPNHDLLLPFIRMTAGPMDYEPGILDNATEKTFMPIPEKIMSMGTRMHQAAMFVVYESPIQLFSGNPSQGHLEPGFMNIIGSIPTTWDETIVLDGKVGEFIVTARKKNNDWFIGGMSNWSGKDVDIDLSFIGDGSYEGTMVLDGMNADRYPSDYTISKKTFNKQSRLKIKMAKGGGFVVILKKEQK